MTKQTEFSKCSSEQLTEMLMGWEAARKGEPFNPHQTPMWQAGFDLRTSLPAFSHEYRPMAESSPPSTETHSTGLRERMTAHA